MTLMCAVLTDDAVLLSADDRASAYEVDPRFPSGFPTWVDEGEKWMSTGMSTVLWGYGGLGAIAKHLMDWAGQGTWSSWPALAKDAEKHSAKAVRTIKEQVRARQMDPDSPWLQFGVFFAGYVADVPKVCAIDHLGVPQEGTDRNIPMPFGGGGIVALASWNVVRALYPKRTITTPQELADFTNAVCDSVAGLDAPAGVWRITPDGGAENCTVSYTKAGSEKPSS